MHRVAENSLCLAVGASLRKELTSTLDALTVGRWRRYVSFLDLGADKTANVNDLLLVVKETQDEVFASADLTPRWMEESAGIKRFKRDELVSATVAWFEARALCWQSNTQRLKERGVFQWWSTRHWRAQFAQVNPKIGLRVADALLAQLDVVPTKQLQTWLCEGVSPSVNAYFIGSDPHSGDHGLVAGLAALIDGKSLFEASKLPDMQGVDEVRLFADAGWSGGESARRLKCIVRPCDRKTHHVSSRQKLHLRFGYLTDRAVTRLEEAIGVLKGQGSVDQVSMSCPEHNLLNTQIGNPAGLAFQDEVVQSYVDPDNPKAMYELCHQIGLELSKSHPCGTHGIGSTIAFEHSLPKAMLPVYITGGQEVKAHDGTLFKWRALLQSSHVSSPASDDSAHHCGHCPLRD